MEKNTAITSPAATQTNQVLSRVYVRDWRKEPVGVAKRALQQKIGQWLEQKENMLYVNETMKTTDPDIDAVCRLNQFRTQTCR